MSTDIFFASCVQLSEICALFGLTVVTLNRGRLLYIYS